MKENELRINNWYNNGSGDKTMCAITIYNWHLHIHKAGCEKMQMNPILLTEEWLIKFGFKETSNHHPEGKIFTKTEFNDNSGVTISYCPAYEFTEINGIRIKSAGNRIQYVHQMQNLWFALVLEELIIK